MRLGFFRNRENATCKKTEIIVWSRKPHSLIWLHRGSASRFLKPWRFVISLIISFFKFVKLPHSQRQSIYTVHGVPKKRDTKLTAVTLLILARFFKFLSLSDSPAKYLLKIPHLIQVATLPCETLISENERQLQTNAVINDKLQGTDVTHLKCGGIFNNQITSGLLSSLPVNFLIGESWHSYEQKGGLCRAFSSTFSMVARRTFLLVTSPYMYIAHFNFFSLTDSAINLS